MTVIVNEDICVYRYDVRECFVEERKKKTRERDERMKREWFRFVIGAASVFVVFSTAFLLPVSLT